MPSLFSKSRWAAVPVIALALGVVASGCVSVERVSDVDPAAGSATPTGMAGDASAPASPMDGTPMDGTPTDGTPMDGTSLPGGTPGPGASVDPSSPAVTPSPGQALRSAEPSIGHIALDGSLPFVQAVSAGIREAAASAGIPLVECDAGWAREGVLACARQLAAAGVHGVISFQPFVELAPEVCAITGDAPTVGLVFDGGPCEVSRLRIDQAASGRLAGDAVGAFAAERFDCEVRAYVSLESSDADPDGRERMQGYRDGYEARCPLPNSVHILDGADRLVTAETRVATLLDEVQSKPIIVVGLNEDAILGAMAAAEAADRRNHLWYSGQLADPAIRGEIACDGHYIASVAQFPERFGSQVVPVLLEAIEGRVVPADLEAELVLVDASNVRELFPATPRCDD